MMSLSATQHEGNGRYELQNIIGKGGQAVVYRAVDLTRRATVAIKVIENNTKRERRAKKDDGANNRREPLNPSDVEDEDVDQSDVNNNGDRSASFSDGGGPSTSEAATTNSLEKEVQILRSLDNKHIIRYLDEYRSTGHLYIVMEYAENGSLLGMLRRSSKDKAFAEATAAAYTAQILAGLKYLHDQGVLHRDVKAANVLVNAENICKLSDFGLASLFKTHHAPQQQQPHNTSATGAVSASSDNLAGSSNAPAAAAPTPLVGSVYWMAPEVIRGEQVTEKADVWSLGCLVVELLTGSPPFYDRTPANAMYCIADCQGTPPLPRFAPAVSGSATSDNAVSDDMLHLSLNDSSPAIPPGFAPLSGQCVDFLQRCLQPDLEERWSISRLEHHPWILNNQATATKPPSANTVVVGSPPKARQPDSLASTLTGAVAAAPPATECSSVSEPHSVEEEGTLTLSVNKQNPQVDLGGTQNSLPSGIHSASNSLNRNPNAGQREKQFSSESTETNAGGGGASFASTTIVNPKHAFPSECPPGLVSRTAESLLFGDKNAREVWLHEQGLWHIVQALPSISAEESFSVLRSLAFAAERLAGSPTQFFVSLSQTRFWDLDLSLIGSRESLAALWCYCCCLQDPSTPNTNYAASQRNALLTVLNGESAKECTDVLFVLVCGPLPVDGDEATSPQAQPTNNYNGTNLALDSVLGLPVGAGAGGGMLGDRTAAAFALNRLQSNPSASSSHRCSAIRRRMRQDSGITGALSQIIEAICNEAFQTRNAPANGWKWVDRLFSVLYALVKPMPTQPGAVTDRWIVALQEAANHRCEAAIAMFVKIVHEQPRLVARELTVGTFLNVVVDTSIDYLLRVEVMRCFPILQAANSVCAKHLEDISCSIPLLALAATSGVPLNERDYITGVIAKLCEKRAMAEVCGAYPRLRSAALSKLHKAMGDKDADEMHDALKLISLMFANSATPSEYTNARELLRTVAIVVQTYRDVFPKEVMNAAQRLQDSLGAQTFLL